MGSLAQWLLEFRGLHARARQGRLRGGETARYLAARDELARALLVAQRVALKPGETPRRALRVARALQADLDLATSRVRAPTVDVSTGGFSCLLSRAPPLGEELGFTLRIPGAEALSGRARVQDVRPREGNVRVSFMFTSLSEADRERMELFVFDTVLAQLEVPAGA